jgi:MerR family transcriptional regulator, copper efflux regulator
LIILKKNGKFSVTLSDFLTVQEAASRLGVSASTLRNWDRAGKLKARRHPINGYRLYSMGELEKVLQGLEGKR